MTLECSKIPPRFHPSGESEHIMGAMKLSSACMILSPAMEENDYRS